MSTPAPAELPGNVRGSLLRGWSENVRARWGEPAVRALRERLAGHGLTLPDELDARAWYPSGAQIVIVEGMTEHFLGGDFALLPSVLAEDALRSMGRSSQAMLRMFGAARIVSHAPAFFSHAYDVGSLRVDRNGRIARLTYSGSALFENQTWRQLQSSAWQAIFALARSRCDARVTGGRETLELELRW